MDEGGGMIGGRGVLACQLLINDHTLNISIKSAASRDAACLKPRY